MIDNPPAALADLVIVAISPSYVKFASPTKLVPLPPVITRLSALFDIVALDPDAP